MWCSRRADVSNPKNCFRSEELRPPIFEESRFAIAESVISNRAFRVKSEDQEITMPGADFRSVFGKLLDSVFFLRSSADGVRERNISRERRRRSQKNPVNSNLNCSENLGNGKLMVFFPENTLWDGAAELSTDGFFDDYNIPPWDTWVGYFEDDLPEGYTLFDECHSKYLVSWIPESFIEIADDGIMVNPEECIMWLSDSKTKLAEILHREKFL